MVESQPEYGAELFEWYQGEHGEETVQAAEQTVRQEVDKKCQRGYGDSRPFLLLVYLVLAFI